MENQRSQRVLGESYIWETKHFSFSEEGNFSLWPAEGAKKMTRRQA